jgi:pimeloyl-ACP methyl ester carboxylesterase
VALQSEILPARWILAAVALAFSAALTPAHAASQPEDSGPGRPNVTLTPCRIEGVEEELRCGVYEVFENRRTRQGRMLPLKIVLIPARQPHPEHGPIFSLAGGPGETATELVAYLISSNLNAEQDVVLLDERGTGEGHRLDCRSLGSDDNLQGYFKAPFDPAVARVCRTELERQYDLSQYTTAAFVEDLEEVRGAMGYEKINLEGGSFGTYAAQMYIRRYGDRVRSVFLNSLVTHSNRVPLEMARTSQQALDHLFSQCESQVECHAAYPNVREDFAGLLAKLSEEPVLTWVRHPVTGARTVVRLPESAFVDAVRVMLYSIESARQIPFLIRQATIGDFNPFAEVALRMVRGIYGGVRVGLNYSVTCNEFVNRIRPEDIGTATRGRFFGAWRIKGQMATCKEWPRTDLPGDFFEAFQSNVPTLLVSGDTDPVSPPEYGEEVQSFMPNSTHLVVPGGGHTPDNACVRSVRAEFFRTGVARGLDTSCMTLLRPAPFKLPEQSAKQGGGAVEGD